MEHLVIVDRQGQKVYERVEEGKNKLAYVHDVSFSPNGTYFAITRHDNHLFISDCQQEWKMAVGRLPMKRIAWIDETRLVLVGYDDVPSICSFSGNQWSVAHLSDKVGEKSQHRQQLGSRRR